MNRIFLRLVPLLAVAALIFSCNRDDDDPVGGKGGNATLRVSPMHHTEYIDSSMVYIKYNATSMPSAFDDSMMCVQSGGKPVATFGQLKKGNYYVYGVGFDEDQPLDPDHWYNVKGGTPYVITVEETQDITVPVTEVH